VLLSIPRQLHPRGNVESVRLAEAMVLRQAMPPAKHRSPLPWEDDAASAWDSWSEADLCHQILVQ
jgi:hypothetical protein